MQWHVDPKPIHPNTSVLTLGGRNDWPIAEVSEVMPGRWFCEVDCHLPPKKRRSATAASEDQARRWAWVWAHRNLSRLHAEIALLGTYRWR